MRRFSGSRCNFFDSLDDFRFPRLSLLLLLLSGPEDAISELLCCPGSRCVPASCMVSPCDCGISAPPPDCLRLRLLFLRKGQTPIFPFTLFSVIIMPVVATLLLLIDQIVLSLSSYLVCASKVAIKSCKFPRRCAFRSRARDYEDFLIAIELSECP